VSHNRGYIWRWHGNLIKFEWACKFRMSGASHLPHTIIHSWYFDPAHISLGARKAWLQDISHTGVTKIFGMPVKPNWSSVITLRAKRLINTLDALIQTLNNVNALQQSFKPTMWIHRVILKSETYGNFILFNRFPSVCWLKRLHKMAFCSSCKKHRWARWRYIQCYKLLGRCSSECKMHIQNKSHSILSRLTRRFFCVLTGRFVVSFRQAIWSQEMNRRGFAATLQCAGAWDWPGGVYLTDRVLLLYYNPQLQCRLLITVYVYTAWWECFYLQLHCLHWASSHYLHQFPTILNTVFRHT